MELSSDDYKKMDVITNKMLINLWSLGTRNHGIRLKNFDYKKKSNLLVLSIAMIVHTTYELPLSTDGSWFERAKWNFKHRKQATISKNLKDATTIDVIELLSFMSDAIKDEFKGTELSLDTIYDTYYGGKH